MASFNCFVTYVKQAAANSNFGLLSHGELVRLLQSNGMTRQEIDSAIEALNDLYKATGAPGAGPIVKQEAKVYGQHHVWSNLGRSQ
jgi:hypothetical protein